MTQIFSSADLTLARRIEAGHAHSATLLAPPDAMEAVAGGFAVFQGDGSPMTQATNTGMNGPVSPEDLDRVEAFFHERGSPAVIDLCTLAEASFIAMIQERGYNVREITNVLARRVEAAEEFPETPGIELQTVAEAEMRPWAALVARGFAGDVEVPEEQVDMMANAPRGLDAFFGLHGGERVAGAGMAAHAGLATLFGDATLPHARGLGLQLALIRHRIRHAAQLGCDLASASVLPGSISHRNYERAGFQLVYARIMVCRAKA